MYAITLCFGHSLNNPSNLIDLKRGLVLSPVVGVLYCHCVNSSSNPTVELFCVIPVGKKKKTRIKRRCFIYHLYSSLVKTVEADLFVICVTLVIFFYFCQSNPSNNLA